MKSRSDVLRNTLKQLQASDFRAGFEDSVLSRCSAALEHYEPGTGRTFWRKMLVPGLYQQSAFSEFFNGDAELYELFNTVNLQSEQKGCFVMPAWGTRGT